MPYVKQERRPALDKVVDELVKTDLQEDSIRVFLSKITSWSTDNDYYYGEWRVENVIQIFNEVGAKPNGDINYILFKYCKYHIQPSYNNYKKFMGEIYDAVGCTKIKQFRDEFRESAEWIRIKLLIPYEEKAKEKNGDV